MEAYKRKIKFRFAWWVVWYSICSLFFFGHLMDFTIKAHAFGNMYLDNYYNSSIVMKYVILVLFGAITLLKFPSIEKLLKKDLGKPPNYVQAKAMLLERELLQLKNHEKKKQEADSFKLQQLKMDEKSKEETEILKKKVEEMEAEIEKIKSGKKRP